MTVVLRQTAGSKQKKMVLFINLLGKGLTQEIKGDRGSRSSLYKIYLILKLVTLQNNRRSSSFYVRLKATAVVITSSEKKRKTIQWKAGKETRCMRKTTSLPRRLFLKLGIPNLKAKLPATYGCFWSQFDFRRWAKIQTSQVLEGITVGVTSIY